MDHGDLLVKPCNPLKLSEIDPRYTAEFKDKSDARDKLESDIERLAKLQDVFAAARSHALLLVLQGMDAAGKDGAIKHVMSGVNPQGVHVFAFKAPTEEELGHDFLWRCERVLPGRGGIGIFNRSYYEEVVVVRVHPELLEPESLMKEGSGDEFWRKRYEDIVAFERHLVRNDTVVVKAFLHVSKDEQRKRLLERVDDPTKNWKLSPQDVVERGYWERYLEAYQAALQATSTDEAPWYVIPADRKWFVRTAIADILVAKLDALNLRYPRPGPEQVAVVEQVRAKLEAE